VEGPHRFGELHGPENLTSQVRGIAKGRDGCGQRATCSSKLSVEAKGEDRGSRRHHQQHDRKLSPPFADQVTTVAREVGVEGKLGGQAKVARRRRYMEGPLTENVQPARREI